MIPKSQNHKTFRKGSVGTGSSEGDAGAALGSFGLRVLWGSWGFESLGFLGFGCLGFKGSRVQGLGAYMVY